MEKQHKRNVDTTRVSAVIVLSKETASAKIDQGRKKGGERKTGRVLDLPEKRGEDKKGHVKCWDHKRAGAGPKKKGATH